MTGSQLTQVCSLPCPHLFCVFAQVTQLLQFLVLFSYKENGSLSPCIPEQFSSKIIMWGRAK